jgi:hypothetical protein
MSPFGYKQLSRSALRDGELGAESGPPGRDVGFSTDFVGSTPESRRGTGSRFSSARDPHEILALGQETAMNCSDRNPDPRSYLDGANVFGQWEAVPSRSEKEPAAE